MLDNIESKITFEIPSNLDFQTLGLSNNYTVLLTGVEEVEFNGGVGGKKDLSFGDVEYERFIGDVWVGIVLTLMIVSSVFCMCSCFLYHKFRQWKDSVHHNRRSGDNLEAGTHHFDGDSLPSYTLVSGLPSYDDALEHFRSIQNTSATSSSTFLPTRPSLLKLFAFEDQQKPVTIQNQVKIHQSHNQQQLSQDIETPAPSYEETISEDPTSTKILENVPSYEETVSKKKKLSIKELRNNFSLNLPKEVIMSKQITTNEIPRIHKSPSAILFASGNDFSMPTTSQQQHQRFILKNTTGNNSSINSNNYYYGSSSLPRNFSTHFLLSNNNN